MCILMDNASGAVIFDDALCCVLADQIVVTGDFAESILFNYLFTLQQQMCWHTALQCTVTTADVG